MLRLPEEIAAVREVWAGLVPDSYFVSWGWIENWLSQLSDAELLRLAVLRADGAPLMAFFLGETARGRRRKLFVNTTGSPHCVNAWGEYNAIPRALDTEPSLAEFFHALPPDWRDVTLRGLDADSFPGRQLLCDAEARGVTVGGHRVLIERDLPSYYVDLALVRRQRCDYPSLLTRSARAQLRRSYRGYEARGPIAIEAATDVGRALDIFDELCSLHERRLAQKGVTSHFVTPASLRFHRGMISNRFQHGEIQLLRITCGTRTLGCLYNVVFNGRVCFFQSGMQIEHGGPLRPGLVCHGEAIKYNAALGHRTYDFLAGDEPYKRRLASHQNRVVWIRIFRDTMTYRLACGRRWLKRWAQPVRTLVAALL